MSSQVCKIPLRDVDDNVLDYALVSPEDFDQVNKHRWHRLAAGKHGWYAQGRIAGVLCLLHHFIFGIPDGDNVVDHIDMCGLNNVRENLHSTTKSGNSQNKKKRIGTSSRYINVCWSVTSKKWIVEVKKIRYGSFTDEVEAGKIADKAILTIFGIHAKTNDLLTDEEKGAVLSGKDVPQTAKDRRQKVLPAGVVYRKDSGKYRAVLRINYVKYELGTHTSADLAAKAVENKRKELEAEKKRLLDAKEIFRNDNGIAIIEIKNSKGEVVGQALVDDDKWHELMKSAWNLSNGHAVGTMNGKLVKMHRYLCPGDRIMHVNGNDLDNRVENLCAAEQSDINQRRSKKKTKNSSSQYRGVSWNSGLQLWEAEIHKDSKRYKLGTYMDEANAALAYNEMAEELFENPVLNEIQAH